MTIDRWVQRGDREPDARMIVAAAARLRDQAVLTPLLSSPRLDADLGGRLWLKAEPLQVTGSFKFRGAFNAISRLPMSRRAAGVIAYSSGNHAQGVAAAACRLGIAATIVMPADAPEVKLAGTRAWGATVVTYDRHRESREQVAAALVARTGAALIRPFDDARIIAGQGTVGREVVAQLSRMGERCEQLLVPCSGGGLVAGCALAVHAVEPKVAVYSVEPAGFDDTARSLAAGHRLRNPPGQGTCCDALMLPEPGVLTFAINRRHLAGGLAVTDDEVRHAMRVALREFRLVLEPGGAVALAAALSGRVPVAGRCTVVVASGGNVDPRVLSEICRE